MTIETGDLIQTENQSDGTWEGPYEVVDVGHVNSFAAGGLVDVLFLREQKPNLDLAQVDFPVTHVFAGTAERRVDRLQAFYYPICWCRIFRSNPNGSSA